jgi:hypothetical protein
MSQSFGKLLATPRGSSVQVAVRQCGSSKEHAASQLRCCLSTAIVAAFEGELHSASSLMQEYLELRDQEMAIVFF